MSHHHNLRSPAPTLTAGQRQALQAAGARIAPTWPLDQLIAVNPWWEMRDQPLERVAARLSALAHARVLMPAEHYAGLWEAGRITAAHLQAAAAERGEHASTASLLAALRDTPALPHWHSLGDWLDAERDQYHQVAWRDEITHQISQFCAARYQADGPLSRAEPSLYAAWLEVTRVDHGIAILMESPALPEIFASLPEDADTLLATAIEELGLTEGVLTDHAHALLLDVNGWASWLAYERWQAQLDGDSHDELPELIAIRLAWELALWRLQHRQSAAAAQRLQYRWQQQLHQLPALLKRHETALAPFWIWQRAAELAYQAHLAARLSPRETTEPLASAPECPRLQAAFCIDVRSERMRRALEAQHPDIETLGFAGFFGLQIAYSPAGGDTVRPQLPGLLRAGITVTEADTEAGDLARYRQRQLAPKARWQQWSGDAGSAFSMVESAGLSGLWKLLKRTFIPDAGSAHPFNDLTRSDTRWRLSRDAAPLSLEEQVELTDGILKGMGLTRFAPVVLLVGHGSHSHNNPHAAGLDCGACGGQTGEVNVRVLAALLNDPQVRAGLRERGHALPEGVRFVAALHNTTTDALTLFDAEAEALEADLPAWLAAATHQVQRERGASLGVADKTPVAEDLQRRARDWSEVRPEWGLAGNAAFIIAPRARTRGVDLEGRTFLHDYDWQQDTDFQGLEQIMTAPMIVTHWINMQYNASVTDNPHYGSGNKVLHNVVGGHLGVFEGNGGDLRIGLPLQSLHDGARWMHEPLRLSVCIEAPREAIEGILERHEMLRQLVDHGWLHLLRWTPNGLERLAQAEWHPLPRLPADPGPDTKRAAAPLHRQTVQKGRPIET
ncbi:DUF2309 family protein [Halomonas alkaliantarctica]|nr:DUF2309 family protein [Halomonas alkaliantarctica]